MKQCLIYDKSLRFARATYGILVLISFFWRLDWLVLLVGILSIVGAFSFKLNLPYVLHHAIINKLMKRNPAPVQKESGELKFVATATGLLLIVGYILVNWTSHTNAGWIYILIVDFLIFLACFVGFCVATLMYIAIKKIFKLK